LKWGPRLQLLPAIIAKEFCSRGNARGESVKFRSELYRKSVEESFSRTMWSDPIRQKIFKIW